MQLWMNGQHKHANWAFLLRRQLLERSDILLRAEIELASSIIKNLLDGLALPFMLSPVTILAILVAIPNTLAGCTLLEGITLLSARRTQFSRGPVVHGGFGFIILPFRRSAERHGAELLSRRRCPFLFR